MYTIYKQTKLYGHLVGPLLSKYQEAFDKDVIPKLADGTYKHREDKVYGLDKASQALLDVLKGANVGKSVVVVSED